MNNPTVSHEVETNHHVQQSIGNKCVLPTAKRKAPKLTRKEKDAIMESLGLTKVRGAVSGRIYYE